MDNDVSFRIMRVKLFLQGHSFEVIDNMRVRDLGDVVGYWSGKAKAEEKLAKKSRNASSGRGQRPSRRRR